MKLHQAFLVAAAGLMLAACGGGGSGDAGPQPPTAAETDDVPASAKATAAAYQAFVASLPASDTDRPLDVSKTTPPTSESAAPAPL